MARGMVLEPLYVHVSHAVEAFPVTPDGSQDGFGSDGTATEQGVDMGKAIALELDDLEVIELAVVLAKNLDELGPLIVQVGQGGFRRVDGAVSLPRNSQSEELEREL